VGLRWFRSVSDGFRWFSAGLSRFPLVSGGFQLVGFPGFLAGLGWFALIFGGFQQV